MHADVLVNNAAIVAAAPFAMITQITAATKEIIEAADKRFGLDLTFEEKAIGVAAHSQFGTTVPDDVVEAAISAYGVILGPAGLRLNPEDFFQSLVIFSEHVTHSLRDQVLQADDAVRWWLRPDLLAPARRPPLIQPHEPGSLKNARA